MPDRSNFFERPAEGDDEGDRSCTTKADGRTAGDDDQVPSHAECEILVPPASGPGGGFLCSTAIQKVPPWDVEFGPEHFLTKIDSI